MHVPNCPMLHVLTPMEVHLQDNYSFTMKNNKQSIKLSKNNKKKH